MLPVDPWPALGEGAGKALTCEQIWCRPVSLTFLDELHREELGLMRYQVALLSKTLGRFG